MMIGIRRTIACPVVLYGCEKWSFNLGERHGLKEGACVATKTKGKQNGYFKFKKIILCTW
jgi:hypothetical protein